MENGHQEEKETTKQEYMQSWRNRPWRGAGLVIGVVIVIVAFMVGAAVSRHRYSTELPGKQVVIGGMMGTQQAPRGMMGGRGMRGGRPGTSSAPEDRVLGAVTAINGNSITVRVEGASQAVAVSSTTSFYKNGAIAKQSDLAQDDVVTVVGTPDSSGTIQAQVITIE